MHRLLISALGRQTHLCVPGQPSIQETPDLTFPSLIPNMLLICGDYLQCNQVLKAIWGYPYTAPFFDLENGTWAPSSATKWKLVYYTTPMSKVDIGRPGHCMWDYFTLEASPPWNQLHGIQLTSFFSICTWVWDSCMAGYQFQSIGHQVQDRKQYLCFLLHCIRGKGKKNSPCPTISCSGWVFVHYIIYIYAHIHIHTYMYMCVCTHKHLIVSHLARISLVDWLCSIVIFGFTEPLFYLIMVTNSRWVMPVIVLQHVFAPILSY